MMSMIRLYTFLIFVAIATVILYVFFVGLQPDYVGKTSLLMIPQTELIASDTDNVTNNIVFMSQSSLEHNISIEENDAKVEVMKLPGTSIIQFVVYAQSANDVQLIKNNVIRGALVEVSKYYDINTDFSMRVVKKETAQRTMASIIVPYFVIGLVIVGLIAGIFALFYLIDLLRMKSEYDANIDGRKIFADYHSDEITDDDEQDGIIFEDEIVADDKTESDIADIEDVEETILKDNDEVEKEILAIEKDIDKTTEAKSADNDTVIEKSTFKTTAPTPEGLSTTPGNLPVVDVSAFGLGNDVSPQSDEQSTDKSTEPTEEELKARLNELLDGKL